MAAHDGSVSTWGCSQAREMPMASTSNHVAAECSSRCLWTENAKPPTQVGTRLPVSHAAAERSGRPGMGDASRLQRGHSGAVRNKPGASLNRGGVPVCAERHRVPMKLGVLAIELVAIKTRPLEQKRLVVGQFVGLPPPSHSRQQTRRFRLPCRRHHCRPRRCVRPAVRRRDTTTALHPSAVPTPHPSPIRRPILVCTWNGSRC